MQAWLGLALIDFVTVWRLTPNALRLADTSQAGGARTVAKVAGVQGHGAQPGAVEVQCGMLHLTRGAAVHFCLAAASCVTLPAVAGEVCAQVLTGASIHTRAPETRGRGYLTVPPGEAWGTVTLVFADVVEAGATIVARARGTGVRFSDLTVPPGETVGAAALVLAACLLTCAPVPAGPRAAQVWPGFLAMPAMEPSWAFARVGVFVGVTGTSIEAGI